MPSSSPSSATVRARSAIDDIIPARVSPSNDNGPDARSGPAALTDDDVAEATPHRLATFDLLPPLPPPPSSGLVEQQGLFAKLRQE